MPRPLLPTTRSSFARWQYHLPNCPKQKPEGPPAAPLLWSPTSKEKEVFVHLLSDIPELVCFLISVTTRILQSMKCRLLSGSLKSHLPGLPSSILISLMSYLHSTACVLILKQMTTKYMVLPLQYSLVSFRKQAKLLISILESLLPALGLTPSSSHHFPPNSSPPSSVYISFCSSNKFPVFPTEGLALIPRISSWLI